MPAETTSYEALYTRKLNLFGFVFLLLHLPVLGALAVVNKGSLTLTAVVMLLLLAGPAVILLHDRSSKLAAMAIAIAAMGVSALTIYTANGLIESHFELFVLIALLTVYGRIAPLLVAGATIALHHVIFWIWLPTGVFNYKASFNIVLIHAFFVILEVIPACWIARQFGKAIHAQGIVVEHLEGAADQVALAAAEVSGSSHALAQGASDQAESISDISASTAEINSMAVRNLESSSATATLFSHAATQFEETNTSLDKMVVAMESINASSEQIATIIKVIDQISFQTNILALNAAVEAARAGQAGAGFAIVADEVRNLAQRSAQAAQDTGSLIDDCLSKSRYGKMMVEQVATEIRGITAESSKMRQMVDEINAGSQEQSKGIEQVSKSIQRMEQVIQRNAAASEETAASAVELTTQADVIRSIVDRLAAINGQTTPSSPNFDHSAKHAPELIPQF